MTDEILRLYKMTDMVVIRQVPRFQGRTDPMGIRAMPWGPPPKGALQTLKTTLIGKYLQQKGLKLY